VRRRSIWVHPDRESELSLARSNSRQFDMEAGSDHHEFRSSNRRHILMLSTHGLHDWNLIPGLQDTGGQNVFINQLSSALAKKGFKITIVNRGGYKHLQTGTLRTGIDYRDASQRIVYLDDGCARFVRKEDMGDRLPDLQQALARFIDAEALPVDLIVSHYWDAGILGCGLRQEMDIDARHVWVPHSLGMVKKRNTPSETWESLRIHDRIEFERRLLEQIDFAAVTSSRLRESLEVDYSYEGRFLWLPPCVDQDRYHPRRVTDSDPIWSFLSQHTQLPEEEIRRRKIITEVSRTEDTKRKDVVIGAFSQVLKKRADILLIISIDQANARLAEELRSLVVSRGITHSTAVVGSIWEWLPSVYAISDIYCTPSVMEGFGMSAQEAAATRVPVIASNLVPFATEYLVGEESRELASPGGSVIVAGEGAIIVPADDVDGFAFALDVLLSDDQLRREMAGAAFKATVPYFTWDHIVGDFLAELGL
jgi:glycosyltransferase involved in cell wall biosynthesis